MIGQFAPTSELDRWARRARDLERRVHELELRAGVTRPQDFYTIRARSSGQSVSNNTLTDCSFSIEDWDPSGMKASGSQTDFTIPVSGRYRLSIFHPLPSATYTIVISRIEVDGADVSTEFMATGNGAATTNPGKVHTPPTLPLTAGQVVQFEIFQSSGATRLIAHEATIDYIGPPL